MVSKGSPKGPSVRPGMEICRWMRPYPEVSPEPRLHMPAFVSKTGAWGVFCCGVISPGVSVIA